MAKVKHIMTTDIVTVSTDTPISQATELLMGKNITGMPVVEDDMTLVGVITDKDVLNLFYASGNATNRSVSDFMTTPAVHFDENEDIREVCQVLMSNFFRRAPVTSNGKVVGVISRGDVLKYMSQEEHNQLGEEGHSAVISSPMHGQEQ